MTNMLKNTLDCGDISPAIGPILANFFCPYHEKRRHFKNTKVCSFQFAITKWKNRCLK